MPSAKAGLGAANHISAVDQDEEEQQREEAQAPAAATTAKRKVEAYRGGEGLGGRD